MRDPARLIRVPVSSPYWGYSPGPVGGALHGSADVIRAEGGYLKSRQQAILGREKARQEQLETRKKRIEHYRWERERIWDMQREHEKKVLARTIERARDEPTDSEVVCGHMLNTLLQELAKKSRPRDNYSEPVLPEWVEAVNFTISGGNAGLLREREIVWPAAFQDDRFADTRAAVEACLARARQELKTGKPSTEPSKELVGHERALRESLIILNQQHAIPVLDYCSAKRFLEDELGPARRLLANQREAAFLLGVKPPCATVAELVHYMDTKGLKFAAASPSGARHYLGLRSAFARELRRLDSPQQAGN